MATSQELKNYAKPKILAAKLDWPTLEKQFQQESGWRHYDNQGNVLTSYTGTSKGVSQLNQNFYPQSTWEPPYANMDAGIETMYDYLLRFKTYRKALAAYNWGPANVAGYKDKEGNVHPAWDGTPEWVCPVGLSQCRTAQRDHYLTAILGPGWPEPGVSTMPEFSVGPGLLALMIDNNDTPATDEMYYKNTDGVNQYSEALGQSGARYVYVFSTNKNYRFLPD